MSEEAGSPSTPGYRHAAATSDPHGVSLTCPECRGTQRVDAGATSAVCASCGKVIWSAHCEACGRFFATVKRKKFQCPNCLNPMSLGKASDVTFSELDDQRSTASQVLAPETLATHAPGLYGSTRSRSRRRRNVGIVVLVVLAVIGLGVGLKLSKHKKAGSGSTPPAAAAPSSLCPAGLAKDPISYTTSKDSSGDIHVTATGTARNDFSEPLHSVVVRWVVMYADLSTSAPTTTSVVGGGTIAKGGSASWSAAAAANDGQVPPSGVKVVGVSAAHAAGVCVS
jgi:hypothetical protein